jgi:hypothetical protein
MSQGLILIDALSSICWEKNEKKRKEEQLEAFFPGPKPDKPCWQFQVGLSWLLGAIKG